MGGGGGRGGGGRGEVLEDGKVDELCALTVQKSRV